MAANDVYKKLLLASDEEAAYAISAGFDDYMSRIHSIACDIYDSCIKDYYASYQPTSYKRHGYPEGMNLYNANNISDDDGGFNISFDPNKLWPYYGKKGKIIRKKVLDNVMDGLRGTGMRKCQEEWPMDWYTSYPNEYSDYDDWESNYNTMDGIFKDFVSNVLKDTKDLRDKFISKYL